MHVQTKTQKYYIVDFTEREAIILSSLLSGVTSNKGEASTLVDDLCSVLVGALPPHEEDFFDFFEGDVSCK